MKKYVFLMGITLSLFIAIEGFSQTYISLQVNQASSLQADAGAATTICINDSTQLGSLPTAWDGTPPYTYSWTPAALLSNPTIANPKASPQTTTLFHLTVTDAKGCTNSDTITVFVNPCTGINNNTETPQVSIYPNPNNGSFNISISGLNTFETTSIELISMYGVCVYKDDFVDAYNNYQKHIYLSHLNAGIYFIRIQSNGQCHTQKVVVN